MPRVSALGTKRTAKADERKQQRTSDQMKSAAGKAKTLDSFNNFVAKLGIGADNIFSAGTYGFNPITRQRTLLEWIHRGSWIGGVAIDVVADDMTRAGVDILGTLKPEQKTKIEETATRLDVWGAINDNIKWSRLYGGSVAVHLVRGQNYETPLRIETIGKDQYKGMLVLDRWQVQPSVNDLVTEEGPYMGLPKFYTVDTQAPGLRGKKIHYTRCIRLEGVRLPYWQRVTENLWGESELERVYDRLLAFDSATTGAAQLVYKSYLRTYGIKGLREVVSLGGEALEGLLAQVEMMRRMQTNEGITLMDTEDTFEEHGATSFSGLAEALVHFGQQISGALQIPLVRLFGQSPAGLNSSGESDIRTYYDGILQRQNKTLIHGVSLLYRMLAASEGIQVPDGYGIRFRPLWQLTETEKAEIAAKDTETFAKGVDAGLVIPVTAMRELRRSSETTGRWATITDEQIAEAEAMDQVPTATQVESSEVKEGKEPGAAPTKDAKWEESKHGRKNNGEFGSGTVAKKAAAKKAPGGAAAKAPGKSGVGASSPAPELFKLKVVKKPVYAGSSVVTKKTLTKLETGATGERVIMSYMKMIGMKNPRPLNLDRNNYPIDVVGGEGKTDTLVECKTGLISNGDSAQQWRATIGQPGKTEQAWLKKASPEEKRELNQSKAREILKRKADALKQHAKETGRKVKGKTITTILNPDTNTADVYVFDGFHSRIAWNSPEAKKAYKGTYAYSA